MSAGSTFAAMKLLPMPRTRMKVSAPRLTFLSCAIRSIRRSALSFSLEKSEIFTGKPVAERCADGALRFRLRQQALARGILKCQRHPDRNGFAVQQAVGKAGGRFQRMAEGVAEIEQRALAVLALVARHDRALVRQLTAIACSRAGPAGENIFPVRLEPREEIGIAKQSVLCDFGIAGAELPLGQRVEQRGVGEHQDRLMEGADQILAMRGIDPGLSADR